MAAARCLARRRAQEDELRSREERVRTDFELKNFAQWENRTDERIGRSRILNEARERAESDRRSLQRRREEMRELYEGEMERWKAAVAERREVSTEERMERMRKRANSLRAKREAERNEYVQSCYDRRWRDGCDEARTLESEAMMERLMNDRKQALILKEEELQKAKEEVGEGSNWREPLGDIEQRLVEEQEETFRKNRELRFALDHQVKMTNSKNDLFCKSRQIEGKETLEQWRAEEEREKRRKQAQASEEANLRREILETNQSNLEAREREKILEREKDDILIKHGMENERERIAREIAKKEHERATSIEFLSEHQKDDNTSEVDAIRNAAMENILAKRDAEVKARANARRQLLVEVQRGRERQMLERKLRADEEKRALAEEAAADAERIRREEEAEREKMAAIRARTVETMEANRVLIERRREAKAREEQEKYLSDKQVQYEERRHQNRLRQVREDVLSSPHAH